MRVEFYRHNLGQEEINAVIETLHSIFLTTGEKNAEFEHLLAQYLGISEVVTTSSCTAALHLALAVRGIGPGDEVITTPLSFVATANSILMVGATPVFVDVDPATGLMDLGRIDSAITARTRGIIPVHLYGQMVDMRRLRETANRHNLFIVEDAAHAIEAVRGGIRPGQLGDVACFSFYATKNITCGEGGAFGTNQMGLADSVRQLRNHGVSKSAADRYTGRYRHWDMEVLGWKYNLTNFQAAILIPQLRRIQELLRRREEIAIRYEEAFTKVGSEFPQVTSGDNRSARHLFTIWVDDGRRDEILEKLQDKGIGVAVNYRPIHLTRYYRERFGYRPGDFPFAERIGRRTISLPLYPQLGDTEIEYVIECVTSLVSSSPPARTRARGSSPSRPVRIPASKMRASKQRESDET